MARTEYDLVVIGGGPGGYVAAIRAAQLGMRTAVVEREHLGGICLNWGCIPTKALLRSAELRHLLTEAEVHGLTVGRVSVDFQKLVARSRTVAAQLTRGVAHLLKKHKVDVIEGTGSLGGDGRIRVMRDDKNELLLSAAHTIVATGARARALPGIEPNGKGIWTYREALLPDALPKRLLVIGSGAIGMEFASFFHDLGSEVTVVEVQDRILPNEDAEVSAFAEKTFAAQGMRLLTNSTVQSIRSKGRALAVTVELPDQTTDTFSVNKVILAVGITGNVEGIGLEEAGVRVEHGHITTNPTGGTGVPGIHAIGDVTGPPWLAHKASHEGIACVEGIAGMETHAPDTSRIPACTYCRPQVASIGLTEAQAVAAGHEVKVGRFPFLGNGKAIALGEPEGLVKTVFDAGTGELLGAHMIGAEVTELIQGFSIARTMEATELDLMHTVFPHPTLSEMMHESTLQAFSRAIHI
ncbi:MAG: dihydrolipoyl dehydrogenase [Rhodospirillales bacterium]|nr:dihydrolipoyl dehydrogenase [Rhodospirillales bacterium]